MTRALLVSVYKGKEEQESCHDHLEELAFLSETYGAEVVKKIPCGIRKYTAATLVTEGKLQEIETAARDCNAELVVFDDEISPAQQRNLEEYLKIPVTDRTGVILEVFAQRAQTSEARLQVELANLRYQAPRLKRLWTHLSRQHGSGGGGGGFQKGEGEKQIELDKRILQQRVTRLQKELNEVKAHRKTQRQSRQRNEVPTFALVGYTNVGKSTLINALTEADVFVEDKLFATLDTTTRKFMLSNNQEILLIDTVGFIRKLPHLLIAAFKSTLEEAVEADILLHLVDVTHPSAEEQAATTFEVLKELGAKDKPIVTVLNKTDLDVNPSIIRKFHLMYPRTIEISALTGQGFDELEEIMIEELSKRRKVMNLRIPQKDYARVSEAMRQGNVLKQDYEENDVILRVDLPAQLAGKLERYEE